jgi:hypothetical protein
LNSSAGATSRLGISIDPNQDPRKHPKENKRRGKKPGSSANKGGRKLYDQLGIDSQALRELLFPPTILLTMKILTWNIRVLNGRSKQRIL